MAENIVVRPSLIALNDKILLHLFTYLSEIDLCALRDYSPRFEKVTDKYFSSTYLRNSSSLIGEEIICYRIDDVTNDDCREIAQVIHHFGRLMLCIEIRSPGVRRRRPQRAVWSLLNGCNAMHTLLLAFIDLGSVATRLIDVTTMRNLRTIAMNRCTGSFADYQHVVNACDTARCEEMYLISYYPEDFLAFISRNIENLRILHLAPNIEEQYILSLRLCYQNTFLNLEELYVAGLRRETMALVLYSSVIMRSLRILSFDDNTEDLLPSCDDTQIGAFVEGLGNHRQLFCFHLKTSQQLPANLINGITEMLVDRFCGPKMSFQCELTYQYTFYVSYNIPSIV